MIVLVSLIALSQAVNFTVSGFSSGGFMAMQLHISHSSSISGAAIISGGPYACMRHFTGKTCTSSPHSLNTSKLITFSQSQESQNTIDPLSNILDSKVWIFGGTKDKMIVQETVKKVEEFYKHFNADIKAVYHIASPHGFVTDSYGVICQLYHWPYINNCDFDSAGDLLTHLYGKLEDKKQINENQVHKFSQIEFGSDSVGMADYGYIFIPHSCWSQTCRVHVALHGCGMNVEYIGKSFILFTGMNEWAQSNSIVVVYPQAARHHKLNHGACWDAKGEWDDYYCVKAGKQISVIFNISQNVKMIMDQLVLKEVN